MEGPAAAAAGGRQPEQTRPADAQTAEPPPHPGSPKRGQDATGPGQTDGAATASAGGSAGRAPGASPAGAGQHKRKPGRPALHQGCQVCGTPLEGMRSFHQRYHICEKHMQADVVEWKGEPQRFCQQCGRFHPLDAFAPGMRSCRKQLAKHAERRRRGRELAAQAAAAAAAAAGGAPGGSPAAPASKRARSVALNPPEAATVGATRLLQTPSTWRLADSTGSGGSSGLHQSVPESGVDALLAAAEEDALAEAEGMDEDAGPPKQEEQQEAQPLHIEPDPAWFAGAATVPLPQPPPQLPAAVTLTGLGPALGSPAGDAARAAALAGLGGGPTALAAAAVAQQAQQAQQAQLVALLLAQQAQQQRQSALAALLGPGLGLPAQHDSTALALALMQQAASGQPAAPQPQAALLQQLLGGGIAALLQPPPAAPMVDDRQALRERHVSMLYQAAVDRLLQTVLQLHPQALAQPGILGQLQAGQQHAQPSLLTQQLPSTQPPPTQPPPAERQPEQQQAQQPAAAATVPPAAVVSSAPAPAQPVSPTSQAQPASQPAAPLVPPQ